MRSWSHYIKSNGGATAVEFALVAPMLITTIVFIMVIGVAQYLNMELDYATSQAARQIMTGSAQAAAIDRTKFTNSLCSRLPSAMSCSDVIVNLYIVPKGLSPGGYFTFVKSDLSGLTIPDIASGSGQFQVGVQGDYQYLLVIYPITGLPSFIASLFGGTTYKGSSAYLAVSTAAFRNERY